MFEQGKSEIALLVQETNQHNVRRLVARFIWLENGKPRNFSDGAFDNPPGLDLSDLEISAFRSNMHDPELQYQEKLTVHAGSLKRMTKTFSKAERGLAKLAAAFGPSKTYGDYVARVAQVFGIKQILFYAEPDFIAANYDDNRYLTATLAVAISQINRMAKDIQGTALIHA